MSPELNRNDQSPIEHDAGGVKLAALPSQMPRVALLADAANDGDAPRSAVAGNTGLEQPEPSEDGRQVVNVVPGRRLELSAFCEKLLANQGNYFERGGSLVSVIVDAIDGDARVHELGPAELARALDGLALFKKLDGRSNQWRDTDVSEEFCRHMLRAGATGHVQSLIGLARQPHLRIDGTVCRESGYDAQTKLFGAFDPEVYPIPERPTREDAFAALGRLRALLAEFPFAADHDRSAALSAILTAAVRSSLPLAPMVHVRAHAPGTGKTYLCSVISMFASGRQPAPLSMAGDNDEMGKLLLAELASAPAVVMFDNLTTDIRPFEKLCTALSSESVSGRLLGQTKVIRVSTRTLFLSSGNNVGPVADMARRCVTINLDAKTEHPAAREYQRADLLQELSRSRPSCVGDALTIILAWVTAGEPKKPSKPLANYESWNRWCRQPLLWLDQPDPATSVFGGMSEDPEKEILGSLLSQWSLFMGADEVMVRDLVQFAESGRPGSQEFQELLVDIAGDRGRINRRRLGWWIKQRAGQIARGKRLMKVSKSANADVWCLHEV